jgi:hypothetical protein
MAKQRDAIDKAEQFLNIDSTEISDEVKVGKAPVGVGRTPKALQLQKYEHVVKRLDDCIDDVMDELISMIHDPDANIRLRVCEMLLKRYIPEKKIKEVVGANGGAIQVNQNIDVRSAVLVAIEVLDEMGMEQIREASQDGNFRLIKDVSPE